MTGGHSNDEASYPRFYFFVFVVNLTVGIGALSLPLAFRRAGLILGSLVLFLLCFLSYITASFIVESLSIANFLLLKESGSLKDITSSSSFPAEDVIEEAQTKVPLLSKEKNKEDDINMGDFEIEERIELSAMAEMFFGHKGRIFFYAVLVVYLYGDLSIYVVAVSSSLQTFFGSITIGSIVIEGSALYHFFLGIFALGVLPWCYLDLSGTRWLQVFTLSTRNICFVVMIILALIFVGEGQGAKADEVAWFEVTEIPLLYGAAVYSFMCHHSIPAFITPVDNKRHILYFFGSIFIFVLGAYLLLCISAVFAFGSIKYPNCPGHPGHACFLQELYTLNFSSYKIQFIAGFIALFPVFSLSTNYPLICVTLRNNIYTIWESLQPKNLVVPYSSSSSSLYVPIEQLNAGQEEPNNNISKYSDKNQHINKYSTFFRQPWVIRAWTATLASVPPLIIGLAVESVDVLVLITGSFPGLVIQYVIPVLCVIAARSRLSVEDARRNRHKSPFQHRYWIYFVVGCTLFAFLFSSFNVTYQKGEFY